MKIKIYNKSKIKYDKFTDSIFYHNKYGEYKVIGYINGNNKRYHKRYIIKFSNTGYITDYEKNKIINNHVKDPYHKSVHDIGYIGSIKKKDIKDIELYNKLYSVWKNMISRCYYEKHSKYNNYGGRGVSVCGEWHNFTIFFNDVQKLINYNRDLIVSSSLQLDKDLNGDGTIYSFKTCAWLSKSDNLKLIKRNYNSIMIPVNVYYNNILIDTCESMDECIDKYHVDRRTIRKTSNNLNYNRKGYRFVINKFNDYPRDGK